MISNTNILSLKIRRDLYQFISRNPGLHISELSLRINMPRSTLRYHLKYLFKLNLIAVKVDRKNKRFYACNRMGTRNEELIGLLRQEIPFKIIMYLFFPGFCSKVELAKELKVHPSTIHFHIKKLLDMGIIKPIEVKDGKFISYERHKPIVFKKSVGREILYTWKNSETIRNVYELLITHKKSMLDPSIINAYVDYLKESNNMFNRKKLKRYFSLNSTIDNFFKIVEEMFHFPFHF